jgi:hypothetical protein
LLELLLHLLREGGRVSRVGHARATGGLLKSVSGTAPGLKRVDPFDAWVTCPWQ